MDMSESWSGGSRRVEMTVELNVPVKLRDGVTTMADVYRPKEPGRFPVLLSRTPYDKTSTNAYLGLRPLRAVSRGYAVVIQDVRGRYASDGKFDPLRNELNDGYDSVEWCASQHWSDGKVGMFGASYVGATQWLAAASAAPHLRCIVPYITASNYYEQWYYRGGALQLSFVEAWCLDQFASTELIRKGKTKEAEKLMDVRDKMDEAFEFFPVRDTPHFRGNADYFYDWVSHPGQDEYWDKINLEKFHGKIKVPAFNIGGWYDIFLQGTLNNFSMMRKAGKSAESRQQKLLVGPWMHWGRASWMDQLVGDVDFGHKASHVTIDMEGMILDWYDRWMKEGKEKGDEPPIRIFVMGENVWRDEKEWPMARTRYTKYYLHGGGPANTLDGDGALAEKPPRDERPDRFVYDPMDPAPTIGGALCCSTSHAPAGPYDQTPIERRKDVLVYSTPPLKREVEVTGPIVLNLFASTSADDTDFTAKLVDAWPCGYAQPLTEGIIRARYRESSRKAKFVEPGRVYEYVIDVWSTSNLFQKGHSIRVEVSSSNFPHFDRNMNTARPVAEESKPVIAVQHIYHDRTRPSHLVLPIIPR
jgi:putative CocE/NonD family hydrolase